LNSNQVSRSSEGGEREKRGEKGERGRRIPRHLLILFWRRERKRGEGKEEYGILFSHPYHKERKGEEGTRGTKPATLKKESRNR